MLRFNLECIYIYEGMGGRWASPFEFSLFSSLSFAFKLVSACALFTFTFELEAILCFYYIYFLWRFLQNHPNYFRINNYLIFEQFNIPVFLHMAGL